MKTFFTIIILCFLFVPNTHAQKVNWAKNHGSWIEDQVKSLCTDREGNIYMAGHASYGIFDKDTMENGGIYIVKYDSLGNVLWLFQTGNYNNVFVTDISVDNNNSIYLTGSYYNSFYFDSVLLPEGNYSFLAKLDKSGKLLWVKSYIVNIKSICINSDRIFITGTYNMSEMIDNFHLYCRSETLNKGFDIFIAKMNTDGKVLKTAVCGGAGNDYAYKIKNDLKNNIYVVGAANPNKALFGNIKYDLGINSLTEFICKVDTNCTINWVRTGILNFDSMSEATNLSIDNKGYVYVIGGIFGNEVFNEDTLNGSFGCERLFLLKYDSLGNNVYAKSFKTDNYQPKILGYHAFGDLAVDADNNLFIFSTFYDSLRIERFKLKSNGKQDVFIAKFNEVGYPQWVRTYGGELHEYAKGMYNLNDEIYICGEFSSQMLELDSLTLINNSGNSEIDFFIASLEDTSRTNFCPITKPKLISNQYYVCNGDSIRIKCQRDFSEKFKLFKNEIFAASTINKNLWVSDSGYYQVTVNENTICPDTSNKIYLKLFQKPIVDLQSFPSIYLDEADSIHLKTPYVDSLEYVWLFNNNKLENTNNYISVNTSGSYKILVSDGFCNNTDSIEIFKDKPVDIQPHNKLENINIFPNPTTNELNIILSEVNSSWKVLLYDNIGRLVYSDIKTQNDKTVKLNLQRFPKGFYNLRIEAMNKHLTSNIILK